MRRLQPAALVTALVLLAAACGGTENTFPDDAIAVRASSDIGVGTDRLLVGVALSDGTRLGSPEDAVELEVSPIDDASAVQRAPGIFTPIVPGVVGLYRAEFEFDTPGTWQVTVIPEQGDPLEPVPLLVEDDACRRPDAVEQGLRPCPPRRGEPAPVLATPTLADAPMEDLTTDPDPDPSMYEVSLDEAVAGGTPTVLVFSTPRFCQTQACGPMLDNMKELAPSHPDVHFIHVEVFTGFNDPDFVPDADHLTPAVGADYYALPSEPWIFVIDEAGLIAGRFEGVVANEEIEALLG